LRSFLLIKVQPGSELEIQKRLRALPEVREIHLLTGQFDLLVTVESNETELDPRQKIAELVIQEIRKEGGILDTRTIIPITSQYNRPVQTGRPTVKAFVFIQTEAGKWNELASKLLEVPDVVGVHRLFGEEDILAELDTEKSLAYPPPQHIANIVQSKISKLNGVRHTDTYVPLESIVKNQ